MEWMKIYILVKNIKLIYLIIKIYLLDLFFIKSSLLQIIKIKYYKIYGRKFKTEITGCHSNIQIKDIENKFDIKEISKVIIDIFVSALIRDIEEQNYKLDNFPILNPSFEIPEKYEFKLYKR